MSAREPPDLTVVELQRNVGVELERIAPVIDDLGRLFADAGHELALVGGPVRDAMLGRPHTDLDFATSARPDETERLLAGWGEATWDMGRDFGTIGCRRGQWTVEVTTYRSEAYDPASRKPNVDFGDTASARATWADATSRSTRWRCGCRAGSSRTRTAVWSTSRSGCCAPRARRRTPSPTTRCGCCALRGSPPSSGFVSRLRSSPR